MVNSSFKNHQWWKECVVFQVYPASFKDTNGDGWGDVNGITEKLDYLKELGIDVVWTSPIYKSPQADMGYDIADYENIDPRYGTLEDVDRLIAELRKRDMKLVMDLVVNHTSEEHAWFLESKSSLNNPKRDWYIWKKPKIDKDGKSRPPNNWAMILGEANSAWTWDETTGEYYLSLFTPQQPDLNWENPDVREAVNNVLKFWLDRGCAGFRMDVINLISKDPAYPDAAIIEPDAPYQPGYAHYANGPRLHEYLKHMNREVLTKYNAFTVGEMPFVQDPKEIIRVVGAQEEELNMIFIFDLVGLDDKEGSFRMTLRHWHQKEIRDIANTYQRLMIDEDGWNSIFCENHDNPRSVSRYCDDSDEYREISAKLLCLMQTTLSGTLYVYQGEELGMRNFPLEWDPEEYKDIESINYWKKYADSKDPSAIAYARQVLQRKARDHSRTPVQWSSAPNAGFCSPSVQPWMRVNDDYVTVNAEAQLGNSSNKGTKEDLSIFRFWQRALKHRKDHKDVFVYGDFQLLDKENEKVFAYKRVSEKDGTWVVVLNFNKSELEWDIPADLKVEGWMAGNYTAGRPEKGTEGKIVLKPWEGILGRCVSGVGKVL